MIKAIKINHEFLPGFDKEGSSIIDNLSQINTFVGQNNSGKSRLIRSIFQLDEHKFEVYDIDIKTINNTIVDLKQSLKRVLTQYGALDFGGIVSVLENIPEFNNFSKTEEIRGFVDNFIQRAKNLNSGVSISHSSGTRIRGSREHIWEDVSKRVIRMEEEVLPLIPKKDIKEYRLVYIPILRGLRPFNDQMTDFYFDRTKKDYFEKLLDKQEVFTGLSLYNDIKNHLLGTQKQREEIRKFEDFISEKFYDSLPFAMIPRTTDDVLYVNINGVEKPIYHLGDGVQSLIILLYKVFVNKNQSTLFFIEEPELHLHPGMQRLLIETISTIAPNSHQFFITTHSNNLLDLILNVKSVSTYVITNNSASNQDERLTKILNLNNTKVDILKMLGVNNSSIFLSNCTIWVEGITDRILLKKALEIMQFDLYNEIIYKEDLHYSFIEYSGANITHWSFDSENQEDKITASKITNRIFLIADKDSTTPKGNDAKSKRLSRLQVVLGKQFYKTEGREIENMISPEILIKTVAEIGKCDEEKYLQKYKPLIKLSDYKNEYLGKYIESNFDELKIKFSSKGTGTILNKVKFVYTWISKLENASDLSPELKKLSIRILDYIKENN